jgi:hypothetical protein
MTPSNTHTQTQIHTHTHPTNLIIQGSVDFETNPSSKTRAKIEVG